MKRSWSSETNVLPDSSSDRPGSSWISDSNSDTLVRSWSAETVVLPDSTSWIEDSNTLMRSWSAEMNNTTWNGDSDTLSRSWSAETVILPDSTSWIVERDSYTPTRSWSEETVATLNSSSQQALWPPSPWVNSSSDPSSPSPLRWSINEDVYALDTGDPQSPDQSHWVTSDSENGELILQ